MRAAGGSESVRRLDDYLVKMAVKDGKVGGFSVQ
jgi:hypothetical protein